MRLISIIFLSLSLITCDNDTQQQQPSQSLSQLKSNKKSNELLFETAEYFGSDHKRYNDILELRNDCFKAKKDTGLLGKKLFIATIDHKTAGYFTYYLSDPKTAFIHDVCVASSYRGSGVGTKLFNHGLSVIEAIPGITKLRLEVHSDNEPAKRLYKSAGFKRTMGTLEPGHRTDFMEKKLPSAL